MLVSNANSEQSLSQNVGLAAFRIAVVQQKAFEETIERVSEKKSQVSDDQQRKADAERARQAAERGGVDIVVRGDEKGSVEAEPAAAPVPAARTAGAKVDVAV